MKFSALPIAALTMLLLAGGAVGGQTGSVAPSPTPASLAGTATDDPRSVREQAVAKLLEGQRHIWKSQRLQTQAGRANSLKLARSAFQRAVELDADFAEAYTALSEIAVTLPPADLDEAARMASKAVSVDRGNFGGHRMLARLYTIKSRLNSGTLDKAQAELAVKAWREVARLDPRNAEAWAFLSAFAETLQQPAEQLDALRKWISAAPPIDVQFYGRVMGSEAALTPESASIKLAGALAATGMREEAASILSTLISDDVDNQEAITMLADLADSTEGPAAAAVTIALQQAAFANPGNLALIDLLARHHGRLGRFDEAISLLTRNISTLQKTEPRAAAVLYISLGDLHLAKDRFDQAAASYDAALKARSFNPSSSVTAEDREFVTVVIEKLIHALKLADKPAAVKTYIDRSRQLLGKSDSFADRQLVSFLESTGNRKEALAVVRSLRANRAGDNTLLRLEASLLTGIGQVDAAVQLVRNRKPAAAGPIKDSQNSGSAVLVPPVDEFSDLLFVSNLYNRAARAVDAIAAATRAFEIAGGRERKQIAKMALASAQHMSGNRAAAEATLRSVLKETPGNPMALNNLGYFLIERGENLEEAVDLIGKAVKTDPRNGTYLDSLGWAYFKLGRLDLAEKYLRDAVRADADSATIFEHLGDVLFERKDTERAKWAWRRALRLAADAAEIERLKKKISK